MVVVAICIPFLILGSLALYNWIGPLILSYELTPNKIEVRIFRLACIRRIHFSNIAEIREVRWLEPVGIRGTIGMIFGERWSNRIFVRSFVLIKPKRGFFHHITLTPKDPTAFVEYVNSHIS